VANYLQRLSGPLLDRIDLQVAVQRPSPEVLLMPKKGLDTQTAKRWVVQAQVRQLARSGLLNGDLPWAELEACTKLKSVDDKLLKNAISRLHLSPRGIHKVLRVARTIADLDHTNTIHKNHLLEALSYRRLDILSMEIEQA
jgi:magnesium chelatase family protein